MNKNNQPETKQILANTLLDLLKSKPFPKITVNELCEKSMIVRSTFYLHFQDKYELLAYCLDKTSKELEALMETHEPKDFFVVLLSNFQEKEKIFFNIFETELNAELLEMFYQFFSRYITLVLEEKLARGALLPGPVESVTAFYVSGLVGMTLRWIKSGYKLSKETLASCQYRLMKDIL
ncbi:MAG: TetR/AcrR family transcriptional regulator C-terminal domain-containing protein [Eubacteriales bacterium]|nr:TetR/AcrR family transcriptional regulator C-terminal domain-containing protein [Eubacteriales bacterium]